jgi:anti-anti-sigma factor
MNSTESNGLTLDITDTSAEELVLTLHGDVDLSTVSDLRTLITMSVASHPAATLLLDMADVSLVDSSGLRLLRDLALDSSMGFAIANPPASLARLLDLTLLSATIAVR